MIDGIKLHGRREPRTLSAMRCPVRARRPGALCGRCVMKENLHVNTGGSPVRSLQIERTRRKLRGFLPILVIVAITSMISSVRDRRPVPAPKRSFLLNAGTQLLRQGKLPEAATEFRRVIKIKPREADAHYLLALCSKGKGSLKQRWRNTALRSLSDPSNRAHHNLAVILAEHGELDEAIAHYRKAIQIKTDVGEFHANLGSALEAQGKLAEAIAEYRNALWYMPENPSAHLNLGSALAAQGNHDAAIAEVRTAREKAQPGSEIARLVESALTTAQASARSTP